MEKVINVNLSKLNQELKLQVEELLFEAKVRNRREVTRKLQEYEESIGNVYNSSNNNNSNNNTNSKGGHGIIKKNKKFT